jgi:hypothetical protein
MIVYLYEYGYVTFIANVLTSFYILELNNYYLSLFSIIDWRNDYFYDLIIEALNLFLSIYYYLFFLIISIFLFEIYFIYFIIFYFNLLFYCFAFYKSYNYFYLSYLILFFCTLLRLRIFFLYDYV